MKPRNTCSRFFTSRPCRFSALTFSSGNPVCDEDHYRLRVLLRLQRVGLLDGVDVSPEEKVKALNLHGRDVKNREGVFRGFMPEDEQFVNQLDAYVEPGVLRAREVRHYSENFVGALMK